MGFFTHVSSKIRQTFANNDKPFATIQKGAPSGAPFFLTQTAGDFLALKSLPENGMPFPDFKNAGAMRKPPCIAH